MFEEQAKQSNLFILIGISLHFIGAFLYSHDARAVGICFSLTGFVAFTMGCCYFAKAKGYSSWIGAMASLAGVVLYFFSGYLYSLVKDSDFSFLLALCPLLGFVVLVILPDRKW